MQRMLSMRDVKAQDLQGLSPETLTALAAQLLGHIQRQADELQSKGRELEVKQKLIERKERDIAWRDAKIEKITFELTRLKRWKFGAKSEAMDAQQRQMFQETLLEGNLLQLRIAPRDVAVLALDELLLEVELAALALQLVGLVLHVLQHLRGQRGDRLGRQTLQVLSFEVAHAEHASHLAKAHDLTSLAHVLSTSPRSPSRIRHCSHPRDHAHLRQALPGQADHQRIELALGQ